jgi:MFS family permease
MFASFVTKWIIAAMLLFSLNFFYYVPEFTCTSKEMQGYDTCDDYVCSIESEQFWFDHIKSPIPKSISLDYGTIMVCSKEWIGSILQSIAYLGSLIGYIIMPLVADNKGRKTAEFIAWSLTIVGCGVLLLSTNIPMIAIGNFFMGFGSNAATILHYSFLKELVMDKLGQRMMIFLQISFSFGVFLIALMSWLITDWKYNLAAITIISSLVLLLTN